MVDRLKNRVLVCAVLTLAASAGRLDAAMLNVANWNMGNLPNSAGDDANLKTVLSYAGASHAIDVMAMIETDTASGPQTALDFSSVYGTSYSQVMTAPDGGSDRTGFVYNTSTLELVSSTVVGGITHPSLRALFRPVGTHGDQDFYYYAVHLQSGATSTIKSQRVAQAAILRADADTLGTASVIFGGDFNSQKADDVSVGVGAYRTFNAPGDGQVFDPIDEVGDWHDNEAFKAWHTNDPGASMDDRFDLQLISSELTDGVGLDYIAGSYTVIGNNGTHTLGGDIRTGTGAPTDVLSALYNFSDHLPVMASYSFTVPEPSSLLVISGATGLLVRRRRCVEI